VGKSGIAIQQEGHQTAACCPCHLGVTQAKLLRIVGPSWAGKEMTSSPAPCEPARRRQVDHKHQIGAHCANRKRAQAVIAPNSRMTIWVEPCQHERYRQARESAPAVVSAANAGIDERGNSTLVPEPRLQQATSPVLRAQAVVAGTCYRRKRITGASAGLLPGAREEAAINTNRPKAVTGDPNARSNRSEGEKMAQDVRKPRGKLTISPM